MRRHTVSCQCCFDAFCGPPAACYLTDVVSSWRFRYVNLRAGVKTRDRPTNHRQSLTQTLFTSEIVSFPTENKRQAADCMRKHKQSPQCHNWHKNTATNERLGKRDRQGNKCDIQYTIYDIQKNHNPLIIYTKGITLSIACILYFLWYSYNISLRFRHNKSLQNVCSPSIWLYRE